MWQILEHRSVPKQLKQLPAEVLKHYEKWKDVVRLSGPSGLRLIKGFHDEALSGQWNGYRSSRLNKQYRVIYTIEAEAVKIKVIKVTPHDYKKR